MVGGGWAGLAAAVEATRCGARVTVLERAPAPGGRARRIRLALGGETLVVDNGQHLLVGAYRATLGLLSTLGVAERSVLHRLPLRLVGPDGLHLAAPRLPAPLHLLAGLLRARGLSGAARRSVVGTMLAARRMRWEAPADETLASWLRRHASRHEAIERLWRPLCLATLNTAPAEASARAFLHVLRDTLGARRADSDFLLPREDLSAVLPDAAARWLAEAGATLRVGASVTALARTERGWAVHLRGDETLHADHVVLATAFRDARRLLEALVQEPALAVTRAALAALRPAPIGTVWLRLPPHPAWNEPVIALRDDAASPGQWLFPHRPLGSGGRLAAVVVSALPGALQSTEAIRAPLLAQLRAAFDLGMAALPADLPMRLVVEHDATWACTPGLPRVGIESGLPGLWLAGDHVMTDPGTFHPATLESAVRSGLAAGAACTAR